MHNLSAIIAIHLATALLAVCLGLVALLVEKGTTLHRACGGAWAGIMLVVATSSFWIREIGGFMGFSWLHILSIYTIWSILWGLWHIRRGNIKAHRQAMLGTFAGLSIAGIFALWPGRRLGDLVWGVLGLN